jgi:hypothetical protein
MLHIKEGRETSLRLGKKCQVVRFWQLPPFADDIFKIIILRWFKSHERNKITKQSINVHCLSIFPSFLTGNFLVVCISLWLQLVRETGFDTVNIW